MKVSILKEDIKKGLSIVSRATSKSPTLPVLGNILISTERNFLKISATNLEIGIRYWILSKVEEEGKLLVPAKILNGLVNFINTPKIDITNEKGDLLVKTKEYKTRVKGLNPDDFPIIPEIKNKNYIEIQNKSLIDALGQVIENTALSQTRPEISGILFNFEGDELKLAATDSFRLAEKTIKLNKNINKKVSFILPQRSTRELIGILSEELIGNLKVYINNNQVMFEQEMEETEHPSFQIISRLIEGEFPDYQKVIPQEFRTELVLDKENFVNEIKKASLFVNKINEIKFKINPSKGFVELLAQNPEVGEAKSTISGKIKGENLEISFNYRFLLSGISSIKNPEIKLFFTNEEGPALLRPVGDEDFFYIVMPIKST